MMFIDIYCGWPGSCHDARVWKNSPISKKLHQLLPENSHLLGDTAYPLTKYLIVPFRDNGHLTRPQKQFNRTLSSTRVIIEQAFGRLKGMFRRLKYLHIYQLKNVKYIVGTACILHNLSIMEKIDYEVDENEDNNNNDVEQREVLREVEEMGTLEGKTKRLELLRQISSR